MKNSLGGMLATAMAVLFGWRPRRDDAFYPDANATLAEGGAIGAAATSGSLVGTTGASASTSGGWLRRVLLAPAAQDWLLLTYLLLLTIEVARGTGERRPQALAGLGIDLLCFVTVLVVVRGGLLAPGRLPSALVYRVGALVPLLGSFFQLQYILPTTTARTEDGLLYSLDLRVFGVEPSEAWDQFVSPRTTEWFAFFYYGYFLLVAVHVLPVLFFGRDRALLRRLSFGFMWVYAVGHVLYTFVPAYGPYAAIHFPHHLQGGFWWPLVKRTVDSVGGGSRTDVFPSLHTAVPTYLTLFSFKNRARAPYRYTWLPLALFTTQIIGATMFLRWHYLVDICAGVLLASSAMLVSPIANQLDDARERAGGSAVWPPLFPWRAT